ncbi:MAG: hypothetical protein EPN25_14925 [Nitrospirae bacterium]|nr:MAG: hypothetical protein EPN25_14925 [Nitrospirota bacterium]
MEAMNKKTARRCLSIFLSFTFCLALSCPLVLAVDSHAVTASAGHDFRVTHLRIYFTNNKPEMTVRRTEPLAAFVEVGLTGYGLLQGYWEVDGRRISTVNQHVVQGPSVIVETPGQPAVPTFDPGTHHLRLVLTSPPGVPAPQATYFVTAEELVHFGLVYPENSAEIAYAATVFTWEPIASAVFYRCEFYKKEGGRTISSADVKKPEYKLPAEILKRSFAPARDYYWRVKAFDANRKLVGESPVFKFTYEAQKGGKGAR